MQLHCQLGFASSNFEASGADLLVNTCHHFRVAGQAVHGPGQHCCCCFMASNQHCHQIIPQLFAADLQPQHCIVSLQASKESMMLETLGEH